MSWAKLNKAYKKHGVVLALGAGVSLGSSLPSWIELLRRLSNEFVSDQAGFDELIGSGLSLPAIAAIIKHSCPAGKNFSKSVYKALYKDFRFFGEGVGKSNHLKFVRHTKENNPTLRSVASLCAIKSGPRTFVANPLIHSVVTFNLDPLLQAYVYARYRKRLVRTIERPSAGRIPDKINVYHMHGLLRFDGKWNDLRKGAPDKLVLTEGEYFDFFNAPTSLFNYTFMHNLREYPCLFIGLSMQDDNIRRLLHYSREERICSLREEGVADGREIEMAKRHFAILEHTGSSKLDKAITTSLHALGTYTLWVNEFQEIPQYLQKMYESTGEDWNAVF